MSNSPLKTTQLTLDPVSPQDVDLDTDAVTDGEVSVPSARLDNPIERIDTFDPPTRSSRRRSTSCWRTPRRYPAAHARTRRSTSHSASSAGDPARPRNCSSTRILRLVALKTARPLPEPGPAPSATSSRRACWG